MLRCRHGRQRAHLPVLRVTVLREKINTKNQCVRWVDGHARSARMADKCERKVLGASWKDTALHVSQKEAHSFVRARSRHLGALATGPLVVNGCAAGIFGSEDGFGLDVD